MAANNSAFGGLESLLSNSGSGSGGSGVPSSTGITGVSKKHGRSEDITMDISGSGTAATDDRTTKQRTTERESKDGDIRDDFFERAEAERARIQRASQAFDSKNGASNGNGGAGSNGNGNGNGNEDETFYDLLCTFAKMEYFHEAPPEPCPVCQQAIKLAEFAKHVIDCVDRLDQEAVKKQMDQDAALALEIAFGDNDSSYRPRCRDGVACTNQSRQHFRTYRHDPGVGGANAAPFSFGSPVAAAAPPKFNMTLPECRFGADCTQRDANHFRENRHPDVNCPICSEPFAVYEMSAHVTLCLQNPEPRIKDDSAPMSRQATLSVNQISMMDDTERKARTSLSPIAERSERPARSPFDDSGVDLSRGQLSAMAHFVMETKEKEKAGGDSVAKLLDSFKLLGFTQEKLKRVLHSGAANDPSSSPPPSSSLYGSPIAAAAAASSSLSSSSYMTRGDSSSSINGITASDDDDLIATPIKSDDNDNNGYNDISGRTIAPSSARSDSGVTSFFAGQTRAREAAAAASSLFGTIPTISSSSSSAFSDIGSPAAPVSSSSSRSSVPLQALPTLSVLSSPPPARLISLAAPPPPAR